MRFPVILEWRDTVGLPKSESLDWDSAMPLPDVGGSVEVWSKGQEIMFEVRERKVRVERTDFGKVDAVIVLSLQQPHVPAGKRRK